MALRTVRLNEEEEKALREIRRHSGLATSAALRRGLQLLRRSLVPEPLPSSYEVYKRLNLGHATGALGPAKDTKRLVAEAIRRKHNR